MSSSPNQGETAVVSLQIDRIDDLSAAVPGALVEGLNELQTTMVDLATRWEGTCGDMGTGRGFAVFVDVLSAVRFAIDVQVAVFSLAWPTAVVEHPAAQEAFGRGGEVLWRGPRVKIGVDVGDVVEAGQTIAGSAAVRAGRLADKTPGGEVRLTAGSWEALGPAGRAVVFAEAAVEHWSPTMGESVRRGVCRLVPSFLAGRLSGSRTDDNLSVPTTALVGRRDEQDQVQAALRPQHIVAIVGSGGIGKSRLALEIAHQRRPRQSGGVWWVDVHRCSAMDEFLAAVAAVLGVPASRTDQLEAITAALHQRKGCLLVVDGAEAIADTSGFAPIMSALAETAAVLVTSRVALPDSLGDVELRLGPLTEDDAVSLFVERGRRHVPTLRAEGRHDALISRIVRRVARIPLAIEIAATRLPLFGLEALADALDRQIVGSGEALLGAIAWAWSQLSDDHQRVLGQLAVCRGGLPIEACAEIAEVSTQEAIDVLTQASELSLLRPASAGGPARLYEPVATYAESFARDHGWWAIAKRRHAQWFADWATQQRDQLASPAYFSVVANLRRHIADLEAIADDTSEPTLAARAMLGAFVVRNLDGPYTSHLVRYTRVLAALPERDRLAGRLLADRGTLLSWRGDNAIPDLDLARSIAEEHGDVALACRALAELNRVTFEKGKWDETVAISAQIVARAREADNEEWQAIGHMQAAVSAVNQGRVDDARRHYDEADRLARLVGAPQHIAQIASNIAYLHLAQRSAEGARPHLREALAFYRRAGYRRKEAHTLNNIGSMCHALGERRQAEDAYRRAARVYGQIGGRRMHAIISGNLGVLLWEEGRFEEAHEHLLVAEEFVADGKDLRRRHLWAAYLAAVEAGLGRFDRADDRLAVAKRAVPLAINPDEAAIEIRALEGAVALARAHQTPDGDIDRQLDRVADLVAELDRVVGPTPHRTRVSGTMAAIVRFAEAWFPERRWSTDGPPRWTVRRDGTWFRGPDAEPVDLSRRRVPARLLARLVEAQVDGQRACTVDDLAAAGWPGESLVPESVANRVYVAIATLRKYGLAELLVTSEEGYQLNPRVQLDIRD